MTKEVKFKSKVNTDKKIKKVKKAGQKKPPKSILIKSDKTPKKEKLKLIEEHKESAESYTLTANDIEELKKPENKKNVVSKRQRKREKFEKVQLEQREKSINELVDKAWEYLDTWKNNKSNWKFQKVRQIWLTDNMYDNDKIPANLWEVLMEYFSGSQGKVRNNIIKKSTKIVQEMSDWSDQKEKAEKDNAEFTTPKPCKIKYKRAREILQCLQE